MNELVSIVVPIYNTEQYIPKCIESLINQTYKNLEIILIDDGSTDNSFNICKKYQKEDERIKLFHKENGGVSSARNYGIKKATGEYICFCDSDDYYSLEALTIMTDTIRDSNADLCCFGRYGGAFENKYISKKENSLELLNYLSSIGSYNCYSKIFKLSIINQFNLLFDESFAVSEDTLWLREYILHCETLCLKTDTVYFMCEREGSLTRTKKKIYPKYAYYFERKLEVLDQIIEELPLNNHEKDNFITERTIHGIKICSLYYISACSSKQEACKYIQYTFDQIKSWLRLGVVQNEKLNKWYQSNKKYIEQEDSEKLYKSLLVTYYIGNIKNKVGKVLKVKR